MLSASFTRSASLLAAAMLALFVMALARPAAAAYPAVATGDVNMRAGPGVNYPVITTVPAGAVIHTHGCLANYAWCDTSWGPSRGWMSANYIQVVHAGRPVVLTPAVVPAVGIGVVTFGHAYWHAHYAGRPWHGRWNYYHAAPYGARRTVVRTCFDGVCRRTSVVRGPYGGTVVRHRVVRPY